jgi:3-phosphoshikimate 1-carboxyvinyltransferase
MLSTEFLDIPALSSVSGTVTLPGSKSISNRVLLLTALSHGSTTVFDLLDSDDTRVMLDALRALGCTITHNGNAVVIDGMGGRLVHPKASLFMGNAGTAIRPLTAVLAVMGGDFDLRGVPRMHERPIGDLVDALRWLGCQIDYQEHPGYPPLHIGQPSLQLDAPIQVRGDVSSQFLTSLLMALPLVAIQDVVIDVVGELISRPYVELTLNLLARFGVDVQREGWHRFIILAGSTLHSPGEIHVEADASSASYFIAASAIASRAGGQKGLLIQGVGLASIQGDIEFVGAAQRMGAQIVGGLNTLEVSCGESVNGWPLTAIDLDCNAIPDAAMTLAVMALYAQGTTTLRNIASWRVKETDRIAAMACELRKLGATVHEGADFIRITPPATVANWKAACICTYDDHRMAMCFSLAAFNPAGLPVRIENPQCVSKTFPDYFETLFAMAHTTLQRIPVICIDGPTASGKGTLAAQLAKHLGYHLLDSGALYRITALAAYRLGLAMDASAETAIASLVKGLHIEFVGNDIVLGEDNVTDAIRSEETGMNASKISALPQVRTALVDLQHSFRRLPGLVADGRDMGTMIFPDAPLKIFLTASAEQRAKRRFNQLIAKGFSTTLDVLCADLEARDARDSTRSIAPLMPAQDAVLLDNSDVSVEESVKLVLGWWQGKQPF